MTTPNDEQRRRIKSMAMAYGGLAATLTAIALSVHGRWWIPFAVVAILFSICALVLLVWLRKPQWVPQGLARFLTIDHPGEALDHFALIVALLTVSLAVSARGGKALQLVALCLWVVIVVVMFVTLPNMPEEVMQIKCPKCDKMFTPNGWVSRRFAWVFSGSMLLAGIWLGFLLGKIFLT
jgi:hypothetical protein